MQKSFVDTVYYMVTMENVFYDWWPHFWWIKFQIWPMKVVVDGHMEQHNMYNKINKAIQCKVRFLQDRHDKLSMKHLFKLQTQMTENYRLNGRKAEG